jgi:hypothetical protein
MFLGSNVRLVRGADNLTATYKPSPEFRKKVHCVSCLLWRIACEIQIVVVQ